MPAILVKKFLILIFLSGLFLYSCDSDSYSDTSDNGVIDDLSNSDTTKKKIIELLN